MGFFRWLRRAATERAAVIDVHLNARLQPMHRGDRFEDPVVAALESAGLRSGVLDAGTAFTRGMRIVSCDVSFGVPIDQADEGLFQIKKALRAIGTPRGSTITMYSNELDPIGSLYGVALRVPLVDAVDFTDDRNIEHNRELDALMIRIDSALGDDGSVWSWHVHRGSDVFVYGDSRGRLHEVLESLIASDPLLAGATLTDVA
ncbi:hypothetical protein [Frondihabitans australicus]|uniref:Uncharacterized protein n=1 Tax=Frondihabitans australicus TaxID=386892 RepID=A0A495IF81_9MICO|nr:hypothetical protein [Frondihabitans australicus]RKR74663.1 hypothetical protein C8E83_1790 [Frondihabitans australicus]